MDPDPTPPLTDIKPNRTEIERPFRVLALDGGGMRGLYTLVKLRRLAFLFDQKFELTEPDIGAAFDLICGTSTGSILACGLASGKPMSQIQDMYIKHGMAIFPRPKPVSRIAQFFWMLRHFISTSGNVAPLKQRMEEQFGQETLGQVYERRGIGLCIPAVDAESQKSIVLKTSHDPKKHRDNSWSLVDVCLASSAAPIFLPLHQAPHPSTPGQTCTFIDGGLWANSPVMIGLIEALHLTGGRRPIEIISVGTSCESTAKPLHGINPGWGFLQWLGGIKMLEYSMAAQTTGHNFMADLTASALNRTGMNIKVIRMPEAAKSTDETTAIGLDRANGKAVKTLLTLATKDADQLYSSVGNQPDDPRHMTIRQIFSGLCALPVTPNQ